MARSHRLYQVDWLKRVYHYDNDELKLAFAGDGLLPLEDDPKMAIALESLDRYPVDVNAATRADLLRVPGVGPTSAGRILDNRARHKIDSWRDLQAMGVVRKRAWAFLAFPGQRPPRAKQLKMDLTAREPSPLPMATTAPCGEVRSCTGCPMFGAPGHPGAPGSASLRPGAPHPGSPQFAPTPA